MIAGLSNQTSFVFRPRLVTEPLGSDNSSTAISATRFYTCQHRIVLRQLQKELSDTFASAKDIKPGFVESCVYLRACIDEAMRLCPPNPTIIPRLVGPGGINVLDQHISEGLYVGVSKFSTNRNKGYFERLYDLVAERWIADHVTGRSEESINRAQVAVQPFSVCPQTVYWEVPGFVGGFLRSCKAFLLV